MAFSLNTKLFSQILAVIAILTIIYIVLFRIELNLWSIFTNIIVIGVAVGLLILAFEGLKNRLKKPEFSPSLSFKTKVIQLAIMSKPFNVRKLFIRGEDMRIYSYFGRIKGILFIPNLVGSPVLTKDGKFVYENKEDKEGKKIFNKETKKALMVNARKNIDTKDGEWLFVVKRGWWILGKTFYCRSHAKLCSEMGEQVFIKCVNLVPFGGYHYPNQQWQADIQRISIQHQAEVVLETHAEWLDLISKVTDLSISSDPNFQKAVSASTENISGTEGTGFTREGRPQ